MELGKKLAIAIEKEIKTSTLQTHDKSTDAILKFAMQNQGIEWAINMVAEKFISKDMKWILDLKHFKNKKLIYLMREI